MPLHLPYAIRNYAPVRKPKPPYPVGPLEEPTVCIRLNPEYIPYILGLLEVYTWDDLWIGTQEEKDLAVSRTRELMEVLIDASADCGGNGNGEGEMACNCSNEINRLAAAVECICRSMQIQNELTGIINEIEVPELPPEFPETEEHPVIGEPIGAATADVACITASVALIGYAKGIQAGYDFFGNLRIVLGAAVAAIGSKYVAVTGAIAAAQAFIVALTAFLDTLYGEALEDEGAWKEVKCALYNNLRGRPATQNHMEQAWFDTGFEVESANAKLIVQAIGAFYAPYPGGRAAMLLQAYELMLQIEATNSGFLVDLDEGDCDDCKECCGFFDFRQGWDYFTSLGPNTTHSPFQGWTSGLLTNGEETAVLAIEYTCPEGESQNYWGFRASWRATEYFIDRPSTPGINVKLFMNDTVVGDNFIPVGKLSAPANGGVGNWGVHQAFAGGSVVYNRIQVIYAAPANLSSDKTAVAIRWLEMFCEDES